MRKAAWSYERNGKDGIYGKYGVVVCVVLRWARALGCGGPEEMAEGRGQIANAR